jgi:hypothetical protein
VLPSEHDGVVQLPSSVLLCADIADAHILLHADGVVSLRLDLVILGLYSLLEEVICSHRLPRALRSVR